MGRVILAGLVAGLVVFLWGAVAHMALPLGMVGFGIPSDANQQAALEALRTNLGTEGVFLLPMPQQEIWKDDAAMEAFGARASQSPSAFVIYQPQGRNGMEMGPMLAKQAASCVLAGLLAAFVASRVAGGRGARIAVVTAMGVFAWLAISVPHWNWYRFPDNVTLAALAEHGIGWLLGGIAIAFLLKPRVG